MVFNGKPTRVQLSKEDPSSPTYDTDYEQQHHQGMDRSKQRYKSRQNNPVKHYKNEVKLNLYHGIVLCNNTQNQDTDDTYIIAAIMDMLYNHNPGKGDDPILKLAQQYSLNKTLQKLHEQAKEATCKEVA